MAVVLIFASSNVCETNTMSSTSAETDACNHVSGKTKPRGRSRAVAVLMLLLSLVTITVYSLMGSNAAPDGQQHTASVLIPGSGLPPSSGKTDSTTKSTGSQPAPGETDSAKRPRVNVTDDELRKLIVGKWQREYAGQRTLTVASGGTASMVIEPDQIWSLVFGNRLETRILWKIENGRIIYHTTSGTPADKYETASQVWGTKWNELIERLDATSLVLLDDNGERYEYTRAGSKTK